MAFPTSNQTGLAGAQRVQTILLHTKDRYHLEPRAWASTFGSAPFLIYSHLVLLDLISVLQAYPYLALRFSSPPPAPLPLPLPLFLFSDKHTGYVPSSRPLTRLLFHHVGAVLIALSDFATPPSITRPGPDCQPTLEPTWPWPKCGDLLSALLCLLKPPARVARPPVYAPELRLRLRGYPPHRGLRNSRPRLCPTQLVALSSLHP